MSQTNNTRQAVWIAIGQLSSMLIAIISPMILSRYLSKTDYGTYKQVMYIYTSLLGVFTLGLPKSYSYFIPRVPVEEAKNLINKITRIFFYLGLVFTLFLFVGASYISQILNNPDLVDSLRIFSVVPLLLLPTMGLEGVYASFQKTHIVAIYTIVTKTITIILTIIPVILFDGGYIQAIIGFDIGCLMTFIVALYLKSYPVKSVNAYKTSISYKAIFRFSIPLLMASVWGMIINSSDQFFISRYYGNEVFAEYSNGFMEFPVITMIIGSISTVLIPLFSGYNSNMEGNQKILLSWRSILYKSVRIIYPIAIFCICFSTLIMISLYGKPYSSSSVFFSIKNIQALFCVLPFSPLVLALGKTKEYSMAHMKTAIIVVALEFLAVKFFDSVVSIACISLLCQFLKVVFQLTIVLSVLHFTLRELIDVKIVVKCICSSLLASFCVFFVNKFLLTSNSWILLFCDFVIFMIVYYFLCYILRISYKDIVKSFVSSQKYDKFLKFIP